MEKKNVILLTVIAVATLLITVVGATFAFYAANVTKTGDEKIEITTSKDLTITYNGCQTITGENILPGWGETYDVGKHVCEISVTNDSAKNDIQYTMKWNAVTNELNENDKANLTVTADAEITWADPESHQEDHTQLTTATQPTVPEKFPDSNYEEDFVTQTLKPGEKVTYSIDVVYKYDETNEQESKGANFTAKLVVDENSIKVPLAAGA